MSNPEQSQSSEIGENSEEIVVLEEQGGLAALRGDDNKPVDAMENYQEEDGPLCRAFDEASLQERGVAENVQFAEDSPQPGTSKGLTGGNGNGAGSSENWKGAASLWEGKSSNSMNSSDTESADEGEGYSYYDSDEEYLMDKTRKYTKSLLEFHNDAPKFERMIPLVVALPWIKRAEFVLDKFEKYLWGLHDRPKGLKMVVRTDIDELKSFERAVRIGWSLWPDHWVGLQMMLDYLAEDTLQEDIIRLDKTTLNVLREIALNKVWKNNVVCGPMLASQAKIIIVRNGNKQPQPKAPGWHSLDFFQSLFVPPRFALGGPNPKRMCEGIDCLEVEKNSGEFKRCGKCKKAFYHSKECQVSHWKNGHKAVCKPEI